jgi:hypothetical protein
MTSGMTSCDYNTFVKHLVWKLHNHFTDTCWVVRVTIMTGSSSDDWILLALRLQSILITHNHNTIAILYTLQ